MLLDKNIKNKNKNTTTLNVNEFNRIRNNLLPNANENEDRNYYDEYLKKLSQAKVKNWPDSIEMSKKNKLEAKKKAFFEKELEKRRIDEEEKKYQDIQKQLIVERASKLLFDNQDSVKSFHSKLLLSDVLKEREYQLAIKQKKLEIEKRIEDKWLENDKEKIIEFDNKEEERKKQDQLDKVEQMNIINKQFTEYKIKRIKEYQDKVVEGEIIKMKAKQAIEDDKKKEREKQENIKKMNEEFIETNVKLEKLKQLKRQKELEEEKKIEEFAIKKQQLEDLKRNKEREKFLEKQAQKQRLIDKQIDYLKSIKNREEEILTKHIKEAEEKKQKELDEKTRKFNELKVFLIC